MRTENRREIIAILRKLVLRLEKKHISERTYNESWGYRDAARYFHETTGCTYVSAERYFWAIEEIAEWRSILNRQPTIRDLFWVPYFKISLPR